MLIRSFLVDVLVIAASRAVNPVLMVVNRLNIALVVVLVVEGVVGIVMRLVVGAILITVVVITIVVCLMTASIVMLILIRSHIFDVLSTSFSSFRVMNSMLMVMDWLNVALVIVLMVELVVSVMVGLVAVSFFMMITVVVFSLVRAFVGLIRSGLFGVMLVIAAS